MDRHVQCENDLKFMTEYARIPLLLYSINISLKYRYIYFETPKAACSTIKRFLIRNESDEIWVGPTEGPSYSEFSQFHDRSFSPLLNPKQVYPFAEKIQSGRYFRFCFVRNPYSRILSAYLDQLAGDHGFAKDAHRQLGLPFSPLAPATFESFVDAVCRQPVASMDAHWKTQFYHTCQHVVEQDFVGRIESFDGDIKYVADRLGLDLSLLETYAPHKTGSDLRLGDYFTPALKRKIYNKFEVDFIRFGYKQ